MMNPMSPMETANQGFALPADAGVDGESFQSIAIKKGEGLDDVECSTDHAHGAHEGETSFLRRCGELDDVLAATE